MHQTGDGGGVFINDNGVVTMKGNTSVSYNSAGPLVHNSSSRLSHGGGIFIDRGYLTMQDNSTVSNNNAKNGGGIQVGYTRGGTFSMENNASVSGNTAYGSPGVNVSNNGVFRMFGGIVYGIDAYPETLRNNVTPGLNGTVGALVGSSLNSTYGDGTSILPHTDGNYTHTNHTIIGKLFGNPVLTGTVNINGIAQVGKTLSVDTNNLGGSGEISYFWKTNRYYSHSGGYWSATDVGTGPTYIVNHEDRFTNITVTVIRAGNSGGITSAMTSEVIGAEGFNVANIDQWNNTLRVIANGGNDHEYTINITSPFEIAGSTNNTFGNASGITVTLQGRGLDLWGGSGYLIRISSNQSLILRDIQLQGHTMNSFPLVFVDTGGSLSMQSGGRIRGNRGEGVFVRGSFYMYDGEISYTGYNSTSASVIIIDGGAFTMQNGNISNNLGGGVSVNGSTFFMNGGVISGNTALNGGGVSVVGNGAIFTMNGGVLSNNSASFGGGLFVANDSFIRIVNGTIYGLNDVVGSRNTASDTGAVLFITGGVAQFGSFNNTTWISNGNLVTTNNTIRVVNGILQP